MKDNPYKPRRFSIVEPSKVSWDDKLKQEEEKKKATREQYKKKSLQLLKGVNAIYNTGVKADKWQDTLKTASATTAAVLGLAGKDSPKKYPDQWYKKAWSVLKKVTEVALKGVTGNVATIALTTLALVASVATGGLAPIIGGAVVLGLKLVKTGMDARKAMHVRKLNSENDVLVEYATQLVVKKQLLKFEPKLKVIEENLQTPKQQGKASEQELKFATGTRIAEKIVDILTRTADVTVGVITNPAQAAKTIGVGVVNLVKDSIIEEVTRTPEVREQLRLLINNERKNGNIGYDNIQDLREQTYKLKMDNQALKETMKEIIYKKDGKYSSLSEEQVKTTFKEKQEAIKKEAPELKQEKESHAKKVLKGIGDALNPYSEFNIKQHSGLTSAVKKENEALEISVKQKVKPITRSMDDLEIKPKQKDTPIYRAQLKEQFKQDQLKLDAFKINKELHSTGHSQSNTVNTNTEKHKTQGKIKDHGR